LAQAGPTGDKAERTSRKPMQESRMTTAANTHLVIADDHPLFRDALRQAVASVVASAVVSEAGSFDDLTALLERDSDVDLGLLDKQIAYELGVSEATIKAHVSAILQKLGVESRTQAVIAAAKIAGGQWRQGTPTG